MARKMLFLPFTTALLIGLILPASALEKIKLGTPIRMQPPLYLPILAAEEIGFWKENGLEVEWVPFGGGTPLLQAVAAGAINIGAGASDVPLVGAARGLPTVLVAVLTPSVRFHIFVKADSSYRHVRELKGKRIGVSALGGAGHVQARVIVAAETMEKDVRFVGAGGQPSMIAGLRAGTFDAISTAFFSVADLKVGGILRDIASADEYLPQPWVGSAVFARKDFARSRPDIVRKVIRAKFQSIDYMGKNSRWTIDKMKSFQGATEQAAKLMYDQFQYAATGRLDRKAVENMRNLFIEYGVITDKVPAVDDLFTNEYVTG